MASPATAATRSALPTLAPGSVSPSTIVGGDGAIQTVRLSGPAPQDMTVWLNAGDVVYKTTTGGAVRIPAGATSATVPFRVAAPKRDMTFELWAQVHGSPLTKVADFTLLAADPATRAVTDLRISGEAATAGTVLTGTVVLNNPAPQGGIGVSVWSNTSYGPGVHVPNPVIVPAGSVSADFPITVTRADHPAIVSPSADLGTSLATAPLVVVPDTFAVGGGYVPVGKVTQLAVGIGEAPNPGGATVALSSGHPAIHVPATVTIPAGSPGVAFPVTVDASAPSGTVFSTITATWNGMTVTSSVNT